MQRKIWVASDNTCNQMVLERLDVPFGRVGAMQVGWGDLEGDSFFLHESLESCGAFIVKRLKYGLQASVGELSELDRIGLHELIFAAGFQWFKDYGIAVIIIQDHAVLATTT